VLARRCETDLDSEIMVYVAKGRERVVLAALFRWTGRLIECIQVDRVAWRAATRHERARLMGQFIQRVVAQKGGSVQDPSLPADFVNRFPAISEFLTSGHYTDGAPRKRSAITILAGEVAGFRCVLNDHDNARSLWATAQTAEGLFVALEALLSDPGAPWRDAKPNSTRR
jgi:hypothetical protein